MEIRAGTLVECVEKYCIAPIGTIGIIIRRHKECENTYLVNWYKDIVRLEEDNSEFVVISDIKVLK